VSIPTNIEPKLRKEVEGILAAMKRAKRSAEDLVIATGTKFLIEAVRLFFIKQTKQSR